MAYTIVKSDGTVLTTIADGTINTTSTSIGLAGRNYAGYGQTTDTNFVHQLENFARTTPPANPLRGQLWFNTNTSTLNVCPSDGETNAAAWLSLSTTSSGGTTTFGQVTVTGNVAANNLTVTSNANANAVSTSYLTVSANANISDANIVTANIGTLRTTVITTGAPGTTGTLTGAWILNGTPNALTIQTGDLVISNVGNSYGIKTDRYMWANGAAVSFAGSYGNSNVALYLPTYTGNLAGARVIVPIVTSGSSGTPGSIIGNWTLSSGSRLNATYADLAERFEADEVYEPGTVVELGGSKEITAVRDDLSEDIFGVVSNTAGMIMNAGAGTDETHPPVALQGRVLVNVIGRVSRNDRLVSAGNGIARSAKPGEAAAFNTIGRALADKTTTGTGTVLAFVYIR
tara:strand:- start:86 stop:1291 length:1206 start_codon:yes stop_codon:yes gene_type:complete